MTTSVITVPHLPIIGNALDILRDPPNFLHYIADTYGDILRYTVFQEPIYLINHPDAIKRVLVENSKNYSIKDLTRQLLALVLGEGLFVSEGKLWLHQRRLMQPLFHQRYVNLFAEAMIHTTRARVDKWRNNQLTQIDIVHEMMELTVMIAVRALFGVSIREDASIVGEAATTIIRLFSFWIRSSLILFMPLSALKMLPQYQRAVADLDRVVYRLIEERRQKQIVGDDLLGLLMAAKDEETSQYMTDRQLRDEVTTLLIAGHETTATALSWLFHTLATLPHVRERLYTEVATKIGVGDFTPADLARLPFVKMVAEETLRLYPPAWVMFRRNLAEDEIQGIHIPAGSSISVSPFAMHRHPKYWQRPNEFYPEHFSPEAVSIRHPFAYIPFGSGPRQCIGRHFAITEMQIVVIIVAQSLMLLKGDTSSAQIDALLTLRPKSPVLLSVVPLV